MRDMVPRNNRSIRDIPVPSHSKRRTTPVAMRERVHSVEEDYMEQPVRRPQPPRRGSSSRRWFIISAIIVVIVCAIGGLLLSTLFAGATVTVFPRSQQVAAPKTLIAKLNPSTGQLGYQTLIVSRSASTTVPATGSRDVSRSASGTITIYNGYNTSSQRLIANTRFVAPDGKIYRIHDSVVVPGAIKNADGTLTAGSISTTVFADSPGAAYNRADTKLSVAKFKEDKDPRNEKFFAMTSGITGGFVGSEPAVAQADLNQAADLIKQGLSQAAQSSLASQVPPGFIAVPGSLQITFSTLSQTAGQNNTATIAQSATMSASVLRVSDLAAAIAKETVPNYGGESMSIGDISQLSLATATTTKAGDTITLSLSGNPMLVWQYDADALKAAIVGKKKGSFQSIIESFAPAISRAEAKVRPFWESSFPTDPKKIQVKTGVE